VKDPLISVCITVFNNAKTLEKCLLSFKQALYDLNFEFVVVDNFSSDNSIKLLKSYALNHGNITLVQERCSRGKGRALAAILSKGKYLIFANAGVYVDHRKLRLLVYGYLSSKLRDKKALIARNIIGIIPRDILFKAGNWRDLNRDSTVDFYTRLFSYGFAAFIPIDVIVWNGYVKSSRRLLASERTLSLKDLPRILRSSVDEACSSAITPKKLIIQSRYCKGESIFKVLVSSVIKTFFIFLNMARGLKPFSANELLTNDIYLSYLRLMNIINPGEYGFSQDDISMFSLHEERIKILLRYFPEVKNVINKFKAKSP